jgi:hypothetical protein
MKVSVRDIFHRGDPVALLPSAEIVAEPHGAAGMTCVECGRRLSRVLEELGSLRCHDCRYGESQPIEPRRRRRMWLH